MRADVIKQRLTKFANDDLGCRVATVHKDQWLAWPLPGNLRFGWMPPTKCTEGDGESSEEIVLALFSPDLIAEVTAGLDDSQLDDYLTIVEFIFATHVARIDESSAVVAREAEDALYEEVPDMLKLRFETEARAIGTVVPVP